MALDSKNNLYFMGLYNSPSIIVGNDTFITSGGQDIYFAKFDTGGNVIWGKDMLGSQNEVQGAIAVDPADNLYVSGSFLSPQLTLDSTVLVRQGGINYINSFLAKLGDAPVVVITNVGKVFTSSKSRWGNFPQPLFHLFHHRH